ncbi:MAG TPA: hypothetical protein VLC07_04570 [Solirubrobacterales bacterium]|nr:hypothetical protein [Solirubrobacterales bacterium]
MKAVSEAFEEHEKALFEETMARLHRDIPEDATVAEAIEEIRRAVMEDDDAKELALRMLVLKDHSHGFIHTHADELAAQRADEDPTYTAAIGGRPPSKEELDLMMQLGQELERRLPDGLSESERESRVVELLQEDETLARLVSRLERLGRHGGSLPPHGRSDPDETV